MDHLRMQSENLFLGFLPADQREAIRVSWYVGATRKLTYAVTDKLRALDHGTQIRFQTPDPKAELLGMMIAQAGPAAGPPDLLNRCARPPCDRPGASAVERSVERELQRLASVKGDFVSLLPEVAFLRVRGPDLVYVLVHNAAHSNVAFMFGEDKRRVPADDTLSVIRGHFGSYPNFAFEVEAGELSGFVSDLLAVRSDADLERFVGSYGIRRTSARFWETADFLSADLRRRDPTGAGLYDPTGPPRRCGRERLEQPGHRLEARHALRGDRRGSPRSHVPHPDPAPGRSVGEPEREGAQRRRIVGAIPGVHGEVVGELVVSGCGGREPIAAGRELAVGGLPDQGIGLHLVDARIVGQLAGRVVPQVGGLGREGGERVEGGRDVDLVRGAPDQRQRCGEDERQLPEKRPAGHAIFSLSDASTVTCRRPKRPEVR
jgi:hypothetical protein